MSMRQLVAWEAYSELEPWGEERDDLRSAIVASTVHNCHIVKRQDARGPSHFMPKLGVANRQQKAEKPVSTVSAWANFKAKFKSHVFGSRSNKEARAEGLID